jgi:GTP-binding protein EngB required for normal cell division
MWGCMFSAHLAIKKMNKKAIILVGDTKVGKSTLFYYLLKKEMTGKKVKRDVQYQILFDERR